MKIALNRERDDLAHERSNAPKKGEKNGEKSNIRISLLFPAYLPLIEENETIHIFLYTHLINNKHTYDK